MDTVAAKEKWLLDMWNDAWDRLKAQGLLGRPKRSMPRSVQPSPAQIAKWAREWDLLMDAILGPTTASPNAEA